MEQITRKNGELFYGKEKCKDTNEVYRRFRDDYHSELGRNIHKRLDRIGKRVERVHGFGFFFDRPIVPEYRWYKYRKVKYRLLGLIGTSYYRIFGIWDIPEVTEKEYEAWFDWAFSHNSCAIALTGRKDGFGRKQHN